VLATVVAADQPRPGQDFFPLTVEYRESCRPPAHPGQLHAPRGRISDHEILVSR